jgi:hypothetical protein
MIRLVIAIAVGVIIAVGGVVILDNALSSAANGSPSGNSLYQYGSR